MVSRFRIPVTWMAGLSVLFLAGLLLPGLTFFTDPADYAILHTVMEFASMAISLMVVALAWNLRHLEANSQVMLVGWASAGVLVVDMAHTLSFPGMPPLGSESSAQKAITFWLAGRVIAAAGFLAIAVIPTRHWSPRLWLPGVAVVVLGAGVAVIIGIYHTQWVPSFFVAGEGLTPLKRIIEYALSASYALAALLLLRRARREDSDELAWLAAAAWTLTLAELYFTLYVDVSDVYNLMGHVLKVVAYAMVYRAIFVAGVQRPYRTLARETSLMRSLIDAMPDLISYTDGRGRLLGANEAFGAHFGVRPSSVVGQSPGVFTLSATRPAQADSGLHAVDRFEEVSEVDGSLRHFDTMRTPYVSPEGHALGVIEVSRDITAQHEADARIHDLAFYDQLTGLPNRSLLSDHATEAFRDPAASGRTQALVFLDLDDFKTTNDTLGHRVGDLLIAETAGRLTEAAGPGTIVARLGGDEFAVLASPCSLEQAAELAARLLAAIDEPYRIEHYDLSLTGSAGVAMFPTDGTSFEDLAVRADAAMYRAKADGRHGYRFFSGDMLIDSAQHLQLLTDLRRAVADGQFVVHYQPQVRLSDGTISRVEALVRWQHPERGLLMPDAFIPVAEESGLILQIGEQVLEQALRDAACWRAQGLSELTVAVNVSAVQFLQADLIDRIDAALTRADFPAGLLELEITESIAMANPTQATATLMRLHEHGVSAAIDDFGTGYSSLAYLKGFAIDLLKIDRSFVKDLGVDANDTAIVDAILELARALGIATVAEGVETLAQADYLRERGCAYGQGYHFHRPMPADALAALLQPVREAT